VVAETNCAPAKDWVRGGLHTTVHGESRTQGGAPKGSGIGRRNTVKVEEMNMRQ